MNPHNCEYDIDQQIAILLSGYKIATAESCTAGLLASRLANIPGCSDYLAGGIIAYSVTIKERILGIDPHLIAQYGVVSQQVAHAMAEQIRKIFDVDIGVGITGLAGPQGDGSSISVGTVDIGIVTGNSYAITQEYFFTGTRNHIRYQATTAAMHLLHHALNLH